MESWAIELEISEKNPLRMVGGAVMVLEGQYDPDQLWLSFMERSVFAPHKEVTEKKKPPPQEKLLARVVNTDPRQMVLSLPGIRGLSNKQLDMFEAEKFPGWERDSKGQVYQIWPSHPVPRREELVEWAEATCRGLYNIKGKCMTFQTSFDAMMAKLRFVG